MEKDQKNLERRKEIQKLNAMEYHTLIPEIKKRVKEYEGQDIRDEIQEKVYYFINLNN